MSQYLRDTRIDDIDFDAHIRAARQMRAEAVSAFLSGAASTVTRPIRLLSRRTSLFVAALALATGAFWTTMLTSPPVTEAAATVPSPTVVQALRADLPIADVQTYLSEP